MSDGTKRDLLTRLVFLDPSPANTKEVMKNFANVGGMDDELKVKLAITVAKAKLDVGEKFETLFVLRGI